MVCKVLYFEPQYAFKVVFPFNYHKNPKNSDTRKICCNHPKIQTRWLYHRVMRPKDAEGIANSVDPDKTTIL